MDVSNSFSVLRAPNAAERLNGLSLKEAFRIYVLDDSEIVALGKRVVNAKTSHAAVFSDGMFPGPMTSHFFWPLDVAAKSLEFNLVDQPLGLDSLPNPPDAVIAVSALLVDRFSALRDILADGKIVAFGTFAQTGIEGPIGRHQWMRSGTSIDVSNGDLCEGQDHRAMPRWTGLSLRLPETPNQPQNDIAPKVAEIPRKAQAQIQTKEKCRLDCVAWLEGMMSNPEIVPRSRDDLWAEAKSKWPNKLSNRAFLKARDDAIANKRAWAWKAPGPKPKSPQS
ncbi:hypothetical protein [Bradyrhizobium erythrophlei]|jgi:hypothetical protein|uniref:Uncharacterized protein n=1 Tax=Bradyrhizobium erythrophlei TaxID=1437360 RepID=A0A1M5SRG7_9BRAD|nr:hypothetical protein [Bradyrhizobium erythrophlei]SHH41119.1 hypothetical protein SAMN05444169_7321 [Bradyrhizobium erythrophlei]